MSGKRSLRYGSTADMPPAMRALVEHQDATRPRRADLLAMQSAPTPLAPVPRAAIVAPDPVALDYGRRPRHVKHVSGEMNKTEARYAKHLDGLIAAGEVSWWGFELIKLRLAANRCWFSVDFLVRMKAGGFELHEVKGRKGDGYFATEDGKLKAKFAAEKYPFWPVRIVWPAKGGGWNRERVG